jgi:hypothetical protein
MCGQIAEHDRAWEMIDSGRREEIDPLWLSCYFLVSIYKEHCASILRSSFAASVPFLRDDIRTSSKYFATSF